MIELTTYLLLLYFFASTLYILVFAIGAKIAYKSLCLTSSKKSRIAVFVPAYKEDVIMVPIAKKLLECDYPQDLYDIIIIADSFENETILELSKLPIHILEVEWKESTKAKSLNHALKLYEGKYDIAVVSDADNILDTNFLQKINDAYQNGYLAIQGKRVAKNLNTSFAILDAASEAINNHIFRKGSSALHLSSALIGSGMAFHYPLLKSELNKIQAVGGFDKELQLNIIKKGNKIIYLEDAITYDEKIEKATSFGKQRRRWLSTQFIYLKKYFAIGFHELFNGNVSYFNLAVLVNIFLPRILTIGLLFIISLLFTVLSLENSILWWVLLLIYCSALFISLPSKMYNKKTLIAVLNLPQAFFIMLISLLKVNGANKKFIHTAHTNTEIDKSQIL